MTNLKKLSPEVLIPRIGDFLVSRGLISDLDLEKALSIQQIARTKGDNPLLGQVLIQMGAISKEQLDHVITEQVMNLRSALEEANKDLEQKVHQRTGELERAYQKVSELSKQKSNFIANISHELRTPLTHIKGYLALFNENQMGQLTSEQRNAIKVMLASSDKLENLIDNLILFSMVDQGKVPLDCSVIVLNEIVEKVIDQQRSRFNLHSVELTSFLPENEIKAQVDPKKFSWALIELLNNSVKFTPAGGKVLIKLNESTEYITLTITDSGIGISPEKIDLVFEPFYQVDGSASRKFSGTGLGLALVQEIIKAHNGRIEVKSMPNQGSQFSIELPRKLDAKP